MDKQAQAMEGIDAAAQMVMEMLRRAAETGEEFVVRPAASWFQQQICPLPFPHNNTHSLLR